MDLSPEELKEVLNIFKAETTEYIKALNSGFLSYEKDPNNQGNLDDIFRTAHSIKGAARMLGLTVIEQVAHELEDTLGLVKNKKLNVSGDELDILYEAVDTIENIIQILSNSEIPDLDSIDVSKITDKLCKVQGKIPQKKVKAVKPKKNKSNDKNTIKEPKQIEVNDLANDENVLKVEAIDSVRVSLERIDRLMLQAGELINTKIRNEQILNQLNSINLKLNKYLKRNEQKNDLVEKLNIMFFDALEDLNLNKLDELEQRTLVDLFLNSDVLIDGISKEINYLSEFHMENTLKTNVLIDELQEKIRETRLLPFSTVLDLMPRMVRDISKQMSKKVRFEIEGDDTQIDKHILEEIKDPFVHILRNSIDHGIEPPDMRVVEGKSPEGHIKINIKYEGNSVLVEFIDDGRGIDPKRIKDIAVKKKMMTKEEIDKLSNTEIINLIFSPGFTTSQIITDISGRGVGMDIVRTKIEKLKGIISVHSEIGNGTTFRIRLPLTLATIQVLIVESVQELYTIPIVSTEQIFRFEEDELEIINELTYIKLNNELIQIVLLDELLNKPRRFLKTYEKRKFSDLRRFGKYTAVVVVAAEKKIAIIVDRVVDEQEVVIKQLSNELAYLNIILGATVLGSGQLSIVLDPVEIIKQVKSDSASISTISKSEEEVKTRILVVDDSITTRTLEKNILEQENFDVTVAINGEDAWKVLEENWPFDIMVSDVEMPYMNGLELVKKVKNSKYSHLPCILCTSLASDYDRDKGIAAGANAYITKGTFDQKNLLDTISQLLGGS